MGCVKTYTQLSGAFGIAPKGCVYLGTLMIHISRCVSKAVAELDFFNAFSQVCAACLTRCHSNNGPEGSGRLCFIVSGQIPSVHDYGSRHHPQLMFKLLVSYLVVQLQCTQSAPSIHKFKSIFQVCPRVRPCESFLRSWGHLQLSLTQHSH